MRAAVLAGPGRLEVNTVPMPTPGPNEVRIQVEGCGVCGSNLPPYEGRDWFRYPLPPGAPGHEGWGWVHALGREVKHLREGDRVAAISSAAYAEFDVVSSDAIVPLPSSLKGQPFPGEPIACAYNVFRRSAISPGDTVAVVGVGFLGATLLQLALAHGARVIAVARRPFAQELAKSLGAHHVLSMDKRAEVVDQVNAITQGKLCDCVVECVGLQGPLDTAAELTRERGRLVIAGYHQDSPRSVDMQLWNWRGLDVINAHERDVRVFAEGMRLALDAIEAGRLNPAPLYTNRYALSDIGRAFADLRNRPDGFLKALVMP
jgi:threonine dehydrogenase-like Zn-dependent dehydrogenase